MRKAKVSRTAQWVATCRGLSGLLPPCERICIDPYALDFGGRGAKLLANLARKRRGIVWSGLLRVRPIALSLYWVQLRTRLIDELVTQFIAGGGTQVIVLGAGFDSRALRLRGQSHPATFFEVDHPATQSQKRLRLKAKSIDDGETRYLPWDFESESQCDLSERIDSIGHDAERTTLTLWEGVTMYLTPEAVSRTVEAVRDYSAPDSRLVFEYTSRRASQTAVSSSA